MADRVGKHNKPSKESGNSMSWTAWALKYGSKALSSCDTNDSNDSAKGYYEKKMPRTDMPMYGVCPASNHLSLIVCNHCGKSITPQGMLRHYELRHNFTPSNGLVACSTKDLRSVPSTASTTQDLPSVGASEQLSSITSVDGCSPAPAPSPLHSPSVDLVDSPVAVPSTDSCARTCQALVDRWSGKRKRRDQSPVTSSSKHAKLASKQRWVDGLGHAENTSSSSLAFDIKSAISPSLSKTDIASSKPSKLDSMGDRSQKSVLKNAKTKKHLSKSEVLAEPLVAAQVSTSRTDVSVEPLSKSGNMSRIALKANSPALSCDLNQSTAKPVAVLPTIKSQTTSKETATKPVAVLPTVKSQTTSKETAAKPVAVLPTVKSQPTSKETHCEQPSKPARRASRTKEKTQRDPNSLPCKDRMFDADIHCGVWIEDINRQCTHSLTCKIHSLSLRRSVSGRSRPFDVLLSNHRAAKEYKVIQRTTDRTEKTSKSNSSSTPKLLNYVESDNVDNPPPDIEFISEGSQLDKEVIEDVVCPPTPPRSWLSAWRARRLLRSARLFSILAPSRLAPKNEDSLTKPEKLLVFPTVDQIPVLEEFGATSSDDEDEGQTVLTTGFLAHQPRPLSVNGFGSWSVAGSGCPLFNRRELTCRWAFNGIVDRSVPRTGSKSQSSMPDSCVISTTVPYCDRYNFIGKSSHATMLSSQPPTLLPIKTITPRLINSSSLSIGNNVYTEPRLLNSSSISIGTNIYTKPRLLNSSSISIGNNDYSEPRLLTSSSISTGNNVFSETRLLNSSSVSVTNNVFSEPRLLNSGSISAVNDVYTDTSRAVSLSMSNSHASNVADSLWRSSFVCISSTSTVSSQDSVGKDNWVPVSSNDRLVSSAVTFQSPMRTFASDGHSQMSISDKEQPHRSFHSPAALSDPPANFLLSEEMAVGRASRESLVGSSSATVVKNTSRLSSGNINGSVVGESRVPVTQNGRVLAPSTNNTTATSVSLSKTSGKQLSNQNFALAEQKSDSMWAGQGRSVERSPSLDVKVSQDKFALTSIKPTDRKLSTEIQSHSSLSRGQKLVEQQNSTNVTHQNHLLASGQRTTQHSLASDHQLASQYSLSKQHQSPSNKVNQDTSQFHTKSTELCTSSNRVVEDSLLSDKRGSKTLSKSSLDSHQSLAVTNSSLSKRQESRQLSVEKTSRESYSTLPMTNGLSSKNSHSSDSSSLASKDQRSPAVITSSKHKMASHKRMFDEDEDEFSCRDDKAPHQNHHVTSSVKTSHQRVNIAPVDAIKSFSQPSPKRHKSSSSKRRDLAFS